MNKQKGYNEYVLTTSSADFKLDRRSNLSYKEFAEEYLFPRKPVIITDATADWGASKWTPEWFKERYADKMITTDHGLMRMDEFIDAITNESEKPGPFLREIPLKDIFPDLLDQITPTPPYVLPNWLSGNYFGGNLNNRLNRESHIEVNFCGRRIFPYLHVDDLAVHAFINQHYGDKELIFYSPDQEPYLYRNEDSRFSKVYDIDNPDLKQFPLFAKAKLARVMLKAGESAFMPSGWWHTTKVPGASLSTVISVANSSNWAELVEYYKQSRGDSSKAALIGAYLKVMGIFNYIRNN
jgi:histone arginine demethylase JMJD6